MVNTFLVCPDYKRSATYLDNKRLGKQRTEAFQIYSLISYLKYLGEYYHDDPPKDDYLVYDWIRKMAKMYNNENFRFLNKNDGWYRIPKEIKMIKMATNERVEFEGDLAILINDKNKKRKFPKEEVVYLNEIYITLGFVYHPAVLMWFNYQNSLGDYINQHIDVWIERGMKNTIPKYQVDVDITRPPWVDDVYFHERHMSNLLRKDSNLYKFDITNDLPYFWPFTLKAGSGESDKDRRYLKK